MTATLESIVAELCDTQRLRGQIIQACHMQKSYDDWVNEGHPKEGPMHDQLHLVFQWGVQYALDMAAAQIGVARYDVGDGSESLEGDVSITIDNILREAGLAHENGDVFSGDEIASLKLQFRGGALMWIDAHSLDPTDSHRVLVKDAKLVCPDFNPEGVAEGVLFPTSDDGTRDAECAVWDNHQDCFRSWTTVNVTCVMQLPT